ncbi:MAG: hypothetical protein ABS82_13240 [Rhodanobacter sp. SCN 67-45]|nr:MAG: hypothetical protein ABS82_13240 [Rhodanobacter sp. SCN 67-45]
MIDGRLLLAQLIFGEAEEVDGVQASRGLHDVSPRDERSYERRAVSELRVKCPGSCVVNDETLAGQLIADAAELFVGAQSWASAQIVAHIQARRDEALCTAQRNHDFIVLSRRLIVHDGKHAGDTRRIGTGERDSYGSTVGRINPGVIGNTKAHSKLGIGGEMLVEYLARKLLPNAVGGDESKALQCTRVDQIGAAIPPVHDEIDIVRNICVDAADGFEIAVTK